MDSVNEPKYKSNSKNMYVGILLIIVIALLVTIPFHYVFYDGSVKVFTKDNFTFQYTFVTEKDIDRLIKSYNNSNISDRTNIKNESIYKKLIAEEIIAIINTDESDDSSETESDDDSFSAEKIAQEYSDNEAKADKSYKGKIIQIKGKVKRITKFSRGYAIVLHGKTMGNINCFLKDKSQISNFSTGDKVVFKGKCEGLNMFGYSVIMGNCEVVK